MRDTRASIWNTQPQQQNMSGPAGEKTGDDGNSDEQNGKSGQGDPDQLGDAGKRALDAERAARTAAEKRANEAEQKLADEAKAKLDEKDRAILERDEARADAEKAKAEATRLRVGAKYGLSPEEVEDLSTAGTPEDFDARAKRLSERLAGKAEEQGKSRRPAADRSQGKGNADGKPFGSVAAARDDALARRGVKTQQ